MKLLSARDPLVFIPLSDTLLRYRLDASGSVDFLPLPAERQSRCLPRQQRRSTHPIFDGRSGLAQWHHERTDPLVQLAVRGLPSPENFSAGETLRDHAAAHSLHFLTQTLDQTPTHTTVQTRLRSVLGFEAVHLVTGFAGRAGILVETRLINTGNRPLEVEMLSSFSITGVSPFAADDAPGRLSLHRFRSAWSNEARHTVEDFESMHLERTWGGAPVMERFGQTGSLPVRKFHPFVAVEDKTAGVMWGAQLAWLGSWQMEVYRRNDDVSLSGGLGDFDHAHWMKRLAPGDTLTAPPALLATATGGIDDLCQRLLAVHDALSHCEPAHERDLPIIFNEWCSTWGKPSHDYLMRTADRLATTRTRYVVIDDGWAEKPPGKAIQYNGDWNVNQAAFPGGLAPTCRALRERGFIPGLWFEFEPCTRGTEAFERTDHLLHRHGRVLEVGTRRFWDFRDPWTYEYLSEKVIRQLKHSGFGYLKVDYNESIGAGCDGAESLGEGLRQHLLRVREFFEKIRREIPDLVIENCSSGGHREEPGMIALSSMSSFSDAHETVEIPIIAASLQRLVPARKLQVWAVLRADDTPERLYYSLAATLLGRMCISGDVVGLDEPRMQIVRAAQEFYVQCVDVLRDGRSYPQFHTGSSRRYPTGWQSVVRVLSDASRALVVLHTFEGQRSGEVLSVPLPDAAGERWEIESSFGLGSPPSFYAGNLVVPMRADFTGAAWLIRKTSCP